MANWRERGYVPDSDDEDEDLGADTQQDINHDNFVTSKSVLAHVPVSIEDVTATDHGTLDDAKGIPLDLEEGVHQTVNSLVDGNLPGNAATNDLTESAHSGQAHRDSLLESDSIPTSTATKLEAEIQKGLKTVQDVLGSLPTLLDSDNDSPLSSVPSSPESSVARQSTIRQTVQDLLRSSPSLLDSNNNDLRASAASPAGRGEANTYPNDVWASTVPHLGVEIPAPLGTLDVAARRRSFRPRAAIQLHPYALEDARYRQAWTDRGLKPVRAPEVAPDPQKVSNEDSQGTGAYESSQADALDELLQRPSRALDERAEVLLPAPNDESQSPRRGIRVRHPSPLSDLEDDLPDLLNLLKHRTATPSMAKLKKPTRRVPPGSVVNRDEYQLYDLPGDEPLVAKSSRNRRQSSITPLSPPRSRGGLSSQDGLPAPETEILMGDTTPALLPTPLVSSDKHVSKRIFAELFNMSDSDDDIIDADDGPAVSSPSAESSNNESQGVQHMRRRIKGVLPASWLKLDMKQGEKSVRGSRHPNQSPVKSGLEKGVAKHVSSSNRTATELGPARVFEPGMSDESTSSESEGEHNVDDGMDDVRYELPDMFEDNDMEDNTVDAMLAPRVRKSSIRKRQQRLTGLWPKDESEKMKRQIVGVRPSAPRRDNPVVAPWSKTTTTTHVRKKIKRKHQKPQMTILDAPGFEEEDVPRFLRIASRRLGETSTVRKQDPAKKFFSLATMRDTQDVKEGLNLWARRQGHTVDAVTGVTSRSPLVPQPRRLGTVNNDYLAPLAHDSQNRPQTVDHFNIQLTSLKQATYATLERVRNHQHRNSSSASETPALLPGQPPIILDYFKPRTSRRDRVDFPSRPRRVVPRTEQLNHAATALRTATALPKRVPLSASAKRGLPKKPTTWQLAPVRVTDPARAAMPVPSEKRDLSPPTADLPDLRPSKQVIPGPLSTAQTLTRASRKQQPVGLHTRNDETLDPRDLMCLQRLKVDEDKDIITNTIRYSPVNGSLLHAASPTSVEAVRSRLLHITLSSMADATSLFEAGVFENTITTPKSGHTLETAGWSAEVEAIIRQSLQETLQITCQDVGASHLRIQTRTDLLAAAASSLESLVTYVNESLTFSTEQELEVFLQLAVDFTETIWRGVVESEAATSDPYASNILKVLNGALLLGYQIERRATALSSAEAARTKMTVSRKSLARCAWELAFREEHIGQLFAHIATPSRTYSIVDVRPPLYVAEVETIYFIHAIGPHQGWSFYMRNILFTDGSGGEIYRLQARAESIACTIIVLGCILSVDGPDGLSPQDRVSSMPPLGFSLRSTLVSRLSEFIKPYIELKLKYSKRFQSNSAQVKKLGRFGLVMFQWCFLLAQNFTQDLTDDLLKAMFKHYSQIGMTELLLQAASREYGKLPRFLIDLTTASQLSPEDTDTDFHIFLKLTATMLTARPPAGCEIAELERKLNLRKSSLMFLLLPNKGRDLVVDSQTLFEEDKDLALIDFVGMANRYSLFATLYHYAPIGFKPAITQISDYLDFTTAHDEVREVILGVWASLVKSVLSQSANGTALQELGDWIRQMFFSMCDKLALIPKENNIAHQDETVRAQYHVHRINREITIRCVCHIAARYTAAIDLCAGEHEISHLLPRDEVSSLMLRCYVDQGLGNVAVSHVFDLLTTSVKKGLKVEKEVLLSFRRDLRGVLVELFTRNQKQDELELSQLLISITEAWYALGKVMVTNGHGYWDQFLNDWSPMSFPQIADDENAKQCQVLLMSKIAQERNVILTDPYPFVHLLLQSVLTPARTGWTTSFVHQLLNQLMESMPDAYGLDALRQKMSNGVSPFFLGQFDIAKHRYTIVDHFIRHAYVVRVAADEPMVAELKDKQWTDLMALVPVALKRGLNQVGRETHRDWIAFSRRVLFRLCLYRGPGSENYAWFTGVYEGEIDTNVFKLERLFAILPCYGPEDDALDDIKTAAKVFLSVLERAYLKNNESYLVPHLVSIFAAAEPDYVEDDGGFLLDIDMLLDFLKAVTPVYVEAAFDTTHPAMQFTITVLDFVAGILERLEVRVDLEDEARMEEFAALIAILMKAAGKAMQRSLPCQFEEDSWEIEIVCRLVNLCSLCAGRWVHLHNLFPASEGVLAVQQLVQVYANYVYEYACSAIGLDMGAGPVHPALRQPGNTFGRWVANFGFEMEDASMPEHIVALKDAAATHLQAVARDWHSVGMTASPVWELRRAGLPAMVSVQSGVVGNGTTSAAFEEVVGRLRGVLVLLGVVEEVL